ncbi:MAG: GNAT family N-acetyltransferase [Candidatus Borkfalkiaceae bacterium]|nr:GNAT family N-acetyltransferase [Clostridia bacterium]MDY6222669.1 GNAT family N-acetyltransferase [Christensenellaceae bacterium]
MLIRKAEKRDVPSLLRLLKQVLELHAKLRPDIFISGTTKYTREEVERILLNPETPVFVAVATGDNGENGESGERGDDRGDGVMGYMFCILRRQPFSANMRDFKTLFIDDLCVDETCRGKRVGQALYEFALQYAGKQGCYNVTLNVWAGNDGARAFYEKMGMRVQETRMEKIL